MYRAHQQCLYSALKYSAGIVGLVSHHHLGGCTPQIRAKPLFFGQKLNFPGRSQQPKMKRSIFVSIKRKKTEFILSSEIKCPKSGIIISGWGESGKVILQISIAVFSGTVDKFFGQRWLSPLEKIGPYACAQLQDKLNIVMQKWDSV